MLRISCVSFLFLFLFPLISEAAQEPTSSEGYIEAGKLLMEKGEHEKAERAFESALQIKSDDAEALFQLAGARLLLCQRESTVDLSLRAIANHPHAGAIYYVVAVRWQQGRAEEARKAFRDYVENLRDPEEKRKAIAAEAGLFSDAALGKFGSWANKRERDCS